MDFKQFASSEGNVWKYVFDFGNAIAEAVLYQYESFYKRTVICCSVQSGCPVGCTFCLPGDRMVLMADFTLKRISEVRVGDMVLGNDLTSASNGISEYASSYTRAIRVNRTMQREVNESLVTIKTANGSALKLTKEHPVAVHRGGLYRTKFIPASEVIVGDMVISCNEMYDISNNIEWEIGWLYGFIQGDGTFSKRKNKNCYRWSVSQSNRSILDFAHTLCIKHEIRVTGIWEQSYKGSNTNYRFEIGDEGILALNSTVNNFQDCDGYKRGWLAGFWDAEGYSFSNNKTTRVCNSDITLIQQFGKYLSILGYDHSISTNNRQESHRKTMYILNGACGRVDFIQKCRPQHPKLNFLDSTRSKLVTYEDVVVDISEDEYSGTVYNLETEGNTYIADNVLVHNCGTGKRFIRNLTCEEIVGQIQTVLKDKNIEDVNGKAERFQIMFMSMGEPFLNMDAVSDAIKELHSLYGNAELLISTVGIDSPEAWKKFFHISECIKNVGLQFSLHSGLDEVRHGVIPFKKKFSIRGLRDMGIQWHSLTGRKVFLNYCVTDDNAGQVEIERIFDMFSPFVFNFTFSVVCSADETMKDAGCRNYEKIDNIMGQFMREGYNVRKFDPAGQDDIGGGCGQLFYVQSWLKAHGR